MSVPVGVFSGYVREVETGDGIRSYALVGNADGAAVITGDAFEEKVEVEWFSAKVDRKEFKQLIKRSDAAGLRHFGLWLALLAGSGTIAYLTWGTWWCIPAFIVYGLVYSMADHHAHELSHGTPFKTRRINEILHHLNGFMTLHEGHYWRWSHSRHTRKRFSSVATRKLRCRGRPTSWA